MKRRKLLAITAPSAVCVCAGCIGNGDDDADSTETDGGMTGTAGNQDEDRTDTDREITLIEPDALPGEGWGDNFVWGYHTDADEEVIYEQTLHRERWILVVSSIFRYETEEEATVGEDLRPDWQEVRDVDIADGGIGLYDSDRIEFEEAADVRFRSGSDVGNVIIRFESGQPTDDAPIEATISQAEELAHGMYIY